MSPPNNHTVPLLPRLDTAIDVILDPAPSRCPNPSAPKMPPSSTVSSPVWPAFCASQSRVLSFTGHKIPASPQHLFALIGAPCPSSTWMTPEDKLYLVFSTHDEARLALSVLDHHHMAVPALERDLEPFHLLRKSPFDEQQQEKSTANKPDQQRMALDAHPHYAHQHQQQGGTDHLNAQLDALTLLHTEPHGVFEFPISSNPPNPKTTFRAGDWICGSRSCAAHNFGRNTTCRGCGSSRPGTAATALLPSPVPFPSTSTLLHISASSAATSSPVLHINSSPPMTINIAASNNNNYPLSMSAATVAKSIHNGNIPHHPHHRASMLPAQPSPRFANLHGSNNNNHRSNTGRTSSLPSSYSAADPRSPTAIANARLFTAGAPKHATCSSTSSSSSSSSLPSSPMAHSDRLNAPGAMYPLLTPSGRAFAAGGRVQNVSRDPMVPCIMYWPENEPLPEPGQMRPASLTGIAQPPILNTGNRGPIEHQPGDWICQKCNYLNWRRRKVCQTCFPYAEGNGDSISAAVQAERIALLSSVLSDAEQRASPLAPAALRATSSSASAATAYSSSSSASLPPSPTSSSSCSSGSGHHHSHHSQMAFMPQVLPGGVRARYEPSSPGAGLQPQLPHGPQSPYKPQQQLHNLVSRPLSQLQQINNQQQPQQRSGSSATLMTQAHRARVMLGPSSAPIHGHHTPASPLAYGTAIYETSSPFPREEKWVSYTAAAEEEQGYVVDDHTASPCLPGFLQHLILPPPTTAVAPQGSPSWPSSDSDVADDNTSVSDSSSCASGPFSSSSSSRNCNNIWSLDGEETKMLHGSARLTWLGL